MIKIKYVPIDFTHFFDSEKHTEALWGTLKRLTIIQNIVAQYLTLTQHWAGGFQGVNRTGYQLIVSTLNIMLLILVTDLLQRTYIPRDIIATDGGNRNTSVELAVTITNVKNQPPQWEKESYSVVIPENTARDTPIVVRVNLTVLLSWFLYLLPFWVALIESAECLLVCLLTQWISGQSEADTVFSLCSKTHLWKLVSALENL